MEALVSSVSAINDFMHAGGGVDAIGIVTASVVLVVLTTLGALETADRRTREASLREPIRAAGSRERERALAA